MLSIKNKFSTLEIDERKGRIISFSKNRKNLLSENQPPLLTVAFRNGEGDAVLTDVTKADTVETVPTETGYKITYKRFEDVNLIATLFIDFNEDSPFINWRADIKCDLQLEWLQFPSVCVEDNFADNGGNSKILFPYNEGVLVSNITARENSGFKHFEPEYPSLGSYAMYPGMVCSPFLAYLSDKGNLYIGVHDKENNTKHIDFYREDGGVKLVVRIYPGISGGNYTTEFDTVLSVFDGEWQDAAEIYRNWLEESGSLGLKKISENLDLPDWYGESPVVITYCVRGHHDTDIMDPNAMLPYINGMKFIDEYAETLNSKIMVILMHWEGTAPWAPPYVWPPYGGEESLKEYIDALHQKGHLLGVYCSGFGWTEGSNIAEYNMEQAFKDNNLKEAMCVSPNGELPLSEICTFQRFGYDLCPAHPFCKETLKTQVLNMDKAGIDYVQLLDQNHGGTAYFCYSKEHGHPGVPGKWQSEAVVDIMKSIKKEITNPKMLFGCESAAAEVFIPELLFSDNRFELNFFIGEAVPLYSYLYHEYLNNFMGNQVCGEGAINPRENPYSLQYRLAYSFVAGDFLTLVINDRGRVQWAWGQGIFSERYMPDEKSAITLVKNMNTWRKAFGKYLHTGKMVKPLSVTAKEKINVTFASGTEVTSPVLTSSYQASDGKTASFIVNFTNEKAECIIENVRGKLLYTSPCGKTEFLSGDCINIEPLSVVMIEDN